MRVFDYDLREVFLGGIDLSYVPSKARRLVQEQSIAPYPDDKVQGQLRAIAICLHKHQNLMPWAQTAVRRISSLRASKRKLYTTDIFGRLRQTRTVLPTRL